MGQNDGGHLGRVISPATIERGRRCENCRWWDNGPLAIQHYKTKRHADLNRAAADALQGGKLSAALAGSRLGDMEKPTHVTGAKATTRNFADLDARMQALGLNYELGDTLMRQGSMGICMVAAAPGDFVVKDYFCGTKYDAKVVVDGAEKHDETADEARERLGLK